MLSLLIFSFFSGAFLAGDVDWEWDSSTEATSAPALNDITPLGRLYIDSIVFNPNGADDAVKIREGSLTGTIIFEASAGSMYDQKVRDYKGKDFRGLYIAATDVVSEADLATVSIVLA